MNKSKAKENASVTANTAYAAVAADKAANIAKYWVNEYFKFTDENTQDYTNENGKAMCFSEFKAYCLSKGIITKTS